MPLSVSTTYFKITALLFLICSCENALESAILDTTPPIAVIAYPVNETTLTQPAFIKADISDQDQIKQVTFLIDGSMVFVDSLIPYEFNWDVCALSKGAHSVLVKAEDNAGNEGQSALNTYTLNGDYNCLDICAGVCVGIHVADDCGTVNDIDGNTYNTIKIGTRLWMSENLKTSHYNNGDEIPTNLSNSSWTSTTAGAVAVYSDQESNADTYGYLYNWYAVDDSRGVCPENFHVPTDDEYKELEMFLGMSESEANDSGCRGTNEGSKLAGNADLWNDGNLENNSEFGTSDFSAFPAGYRNNNGSYSSMGNYGYYWSSSETNSSTA